MSGDHLALEATVCGLNFRIFTCSAPEPGERWDPEDGPRPRSGVIAFLSRDEPVCWCRGHETCYACGLIREIDVAYTSVQGPHCRAWVQLLASMRYDARFAQVFSDGACLVGLFDDEG